jgi:hypothetical protein
LIECGYEYEKMRRDGAFLEELETPVHPQLEVE